MSKPASTKKGVKDVPAEGTKMKKGAAPATDAKKQPTKGKAKEEEKPEEKKKEKYMGGRKLRAAVKATNRKTKLVQANETRRRSSTAPRHDQLKWFQAKIELQADKTQFTHDEIVALLDAYIKIDVDELAKLRGVYREREKYRRAVRTAADLKVESQLERKISEFKRLIANGGIEAPDLTSPSVVLQLREWNGKSETMLAIRFTRFIRSKPTSSPSAAAAASSVPSSDSQTVSEETADQ